MQSFVPRSNRIAKGLFLYNCRIKHLLNLNYTPMVKKSHLILLTPLSILSLAAPIYGVANPRNLVAITSLSPFQQVVSGKVIDETGKPISGVTVSEKGKAAATTTNQDGIFSLNVSSKSAILTFNSIGFTAKEVSAAQAAQITLT